MNIEKELIQFFEKYEIKFEYKEKSFFLKDSTVEIVLAEFETFTEPKVNRIILRNHDWVLKKEIIQSKIFTILGRNSKIHGRQTKIKRIDANIAKEFLIENHSKGYLNAKLKIGCFLKEELVAVMTFGTKRKFSHFENYVSLEMIQYASKQGFSVVGGLDKLLNYAEKEFKPNEIMTYLDQELAIGDAWEKLGFQCVSISKPILFEIDPITFEAKKVITIENEFSYANLGNKKMVRINQNLG
jgi:hypothetical protein